MNDLSLQDLPSCYRGLADAIEAWREEKENGFDGTLNEFLEMRKSEIEDGNDEATIDRLLEGLFERHRYSIIERVCKKWLCEVRG